MKLIVNRYTTLIVIKVVYYNFEKNNRVGEYAYDVSEYV